MTSTKYPEGTTLTFKMTGKVVGDGSVRIGCRTFSLAEVLEVATDLVADTPKPKFAIGDRVVYTGNETRGLKGHKGTVSRLSDFTGTSIYVKFDGRDLDQGVFAVNVEKFTGTDYQAGDVYLNREGTPRVRDAAGRWRGPSYIGAESDDRAEWLVQNNAGARFIVVGGKPVGS